MAGLSISQQKGVEAGDTIFDGVFETVALGLSDNYTVLRANGVELQDPRRFKDDEDYRSYLRMVTTEVLENETERAKKIREVYKKLKPSEPDIPLLDDLYKARRAGRQAVSHNTGDYSFLGGSTIANAIVGFFKWIGKLFMHLVDKIRGKAEGDMPSLFKTIGKDVVDNTVGEFGKNMQAEGVDPQFAGLLMEEMRKKGEVKAGLRPDTDTTPVRTLKDLKKPEEKQYTAFGKMESDDDKKKELAKHYSEMGENILIGLPAEIRTGPMADTFRTALKTEAEKAFEKYKGQKLTPEQVELMDKEVLLGTLKAVKPALLEKFKDSKPDIEAMDDALSKSASIKAALDMLNAAKNEKAATLLRLLAAPMMEEKRTGSLVALLDAAGMLADKAAVTARLKESGKQVMPVNMDEEISKGVRKFMDSKEVKEKFTVSNIRTNLDEAISAAIQKKAGWASGIVDSGAAQTVKGWGKWALEKVGADGIAKKADGLLPPTDDERADLAEFISQNLPAVLERQLVAHLKKTGSPPDVKKLDGGALANDVVKEFKAKLTKSDHVPALWKESDNLEMLLGPIRTQLKDAVDKNREKFSVSADSSAKLAEVAVSRTPRLPVEPELRPPGEQPPAGKAACYAPIAQSPDAGGLRPLKPFTDAPLKTSGRSGSPPYL